MIPPGVWLDAVRRRGHESDVKAGPRGEGGRVGVGPSSTGSGPPSYLCAGCRGQCGSLRINSANGKIYCSTNCEFGDSANAVMAKRVR